jgi:hypothetical protein
VNTTVTDTNGDAHVPQTRTATYRVIDAFDVASNECTVTIGGATPGEIPPPPPPPPPETQWGNGIAAPYGTSGQAPYAVHVHAHDIDLAVGNDKLDALYRWDFGDPGGSFNVLPGWNAAHLYQVPGTYTVTLEITEPPTATAPAKVQRHRLSVSVGVSTRRKVIGDVDTVLSDTDLTITSGDRAKPIVVKGSNIYIHGGALRWTGANDYRGIFDIDPSCTNVVIDGVDLSSKYGGTDREDKPVRGVQLAGKNVAIVNCRFHDIGDPVNGEDKPSAVLLLKNTCADEIAGYFAWMQGRQWVLLGNTVPNSRVEHDARAYADWVLAVGNTLANPGGENDERKGTFSPRSGAWHWYEDNETGIGAWSMGPLEGTTYFLQDVVVAGNDIGDQVELWPGTRRVVFRNNTIVVAGKAAIYVRPRKSGDAADRKVENVTLAGNVVKAPSLINGDTSALAYRDRGNTFNGAAVN